MGRIWRSPPNHISFPSGAADSSPHLPLLPVHHRLLLSWPRRSGESMQCTPGTQTCSDHTLQAAARSCVGQCMEPGARGWVKSALGTSGATLGFTPCPSPPAPCRARPTSHPGHPIPKSQPIGSCAWSFSIVFNFLKGELLIYFWNNVGEEEGKMDLKSTTKLPLPRALASLLPPPAVSPLPRSLCQELQVTPWPWHGGPTTAPQHCSAPLPVVLLPGHGVGCGTR